MFTKLSKEVIDRLKACLFLTAAFTEQGLEIVTGIRGLIKERAENLSEEGQSGSEESDILGTFRFLGQQMRQKIDLAIAIEKQIYALNVRLDEFRKVRDSEATVLGQKRAGLRNTILGQYVKPNISALGVQGGVPRDATALAINLELIQDRFQDSEMLDNRLGRPLFKKAHQQVVEQAGELLKPTKELRETLETIAKLERRVAVLLARKHTTLEGYDPWFLRSARMFSDLCRIAGNTELADRVRPSRNRPGRTEETPDVPDETVAEAVNETPAAVEPDVDPEAEEIALPLNTQPGSDTPQPAEDDPPDSPDPD